MGDGELIDTVGPEEIVVESCGGVDSHTRVSCLVNTATCLLDLIGDSISVRKI